MLTRQQLVDSLLNDRTHHIEFNGHLTNHNKHAVIALDKLGASNERIKDYYDTYAKCTPYGYGLEPARKSRYQITADNWQQYLGKRTSYSSYYDFFDNEEKRLGLDLFLSTYLPTLLPGWASALTHAAIHLGWALDIGNRTMTIEGVAYMAYCFVSCHPDRVYKVSTEITDTDTAIDTLVNIAVEWEKLSPELEHWAEDVVDINQSLENTHINPELARSGLQYRVARMLETGHPLIYAIPKWLCDDNINEIWLKLHEMVTLLYLNEPGDFLLLHFITVVHGMREIANRMSLTMQYEIARNVWVGLLAILFSRASFPASADLRSKCAQYSDMTDDALSPEVISYWEKVIARAIKEEEEHNPKMVYALKKMWELSGCKKIFREAATCFTTTPELPKSFNNPITIG